MANNVKQFIDAKYTGVLGIFGPPSDPLLSYSSDSIAFINPYSGDYKLRGREFVLRDGATFESSPGPPKNFINIRGSRLDEAAAMINLLTKRIPGISRISVFSASDTYSRNFVIT